MAALDRIARRRDCDSFLRKAPLEQLRAQFPPVIPGTWQTKAVRWLLSEDEFFQRLSVAAVLELRDSALRQECLIRKGVPPVKSRRVPKDYRRLVNVLLDGACWSLLSNELRLLQEQEKNCSDHESKKFLERSLTTIVSTLFARNEASYFSPVLEDDWITRAGSWEQLDWSAQTLQNNEPVWTHSLRVRSLKNIPKSPPLDLTLEMLFLQDASLENLEFLFPRLPPCGGSALTNACCHTDAKNVLPWLIQKCPWTLKNTSACRDVLIFAKNHGIAVSDDTLATVIRASPTCVDSGFFYYLLARKRDATAVFAVMPDPVRRSLLMSQNFFKKHKEALRYHPRVFDAALLWSWLTQSTHVDQDASLTQAATQFARALMPAKLPFAIELFGLELSKKEYVLHLENNLVAACACVFGACVRAGVPTEMLQKASFIHCNHGGKVQHFNLWKELTLRPSDLWRSLFDKGYFDGCLVCKTEAAESHIIEELRKPMGPLSKDFDHTLGVWWFALNDPCCARRNKVFEKLCQMPAAVTFYLTTEETRQMALERSPPQCFQEAGLDMCIETHDHEAFLQCLKAGWCLSPTACERAFAWSNTEVLKRLLPTAFVRWAQPCVQNFLTSTPHSFCEVVDFCLKKAIVRCDTGLSEDLCALVTRYASFRGLTLFAEDFRNLFPQ